MLGPSRVARATAHTVATPRIRGVAIDYQNGGNLDG